MSQVDVADATVKGFEGVAPATQIIFSLFIHANGLTADNYGSAYNNFKTDANKQQYYSDVNTMIQNLNQGKLIDRNGKQVDYKINGQSVDFSKGIVEIWINPEDAQNDPDMYLSNGLYMKIISVNGQVVAIMSPKTEDAMQVSKFQKEVFTPVQIVTSLDSGSDLTHPSWFDNQFMGGLTEDGTDNGTAVKGNISFVP
jgi:hypothetical protein